MIDLLATRIAQERIRQRGYRDLDVNLLLRLAEPCGDDAYHLSNRVVDREIERLKGEIRQIERLAGSVAVVCCGAIVTVHHGD